MKDKIELITSEAGDYEVLVVNGKEVRCGNQIPTFTWLSLLSNYAEVKETELTEQEIYDRYHYVSI